MKVTVLVPIYNAEVHLSKALEGILAQTHRDFELILLDDGSTDQSQSIAESYANADTRIRVMAATS